MILQFSALVCGLIFGLGLCLSNMSNPQKVLGFLDVAGHWDPSLALVMVGALGVAGVSRVFIMRRSGPVLSESFQIPTATAIDKSLVIGAILFGIGWGLSGICPGPAVTVLSLGIPEIYVFVSAMLGGMWLFKVLQTR
jgi:uncharacterized protein